MSDPTTDRPAEMPDYADERKVVDDAEAEAQSDPREAIYPRTNRTLPPPPSRGATHEAFGDQHPTVGVTARLGPRADNAEDGRTDADDADDEEEGEAESPELPATVADLKALARSIKERNKGTPVRHYDPELDRWFYGRLLTSRDVDSASAFANDDADPVGQPVANNQAFLKWLVMFCFKDVNEVFWAALGDVPASIKGRLIRAARNAAGLGDEVVAEGKSSSKPTRKSATS